ncbi:unnamed protein product [Rangifer tarandus platyrhynchus]|uniref:Uncharacterized protein n=1 Tax=Rangifer tarandus platyrhynchus TaxID=3082113 RepID=A0AC59ZRL8_RANTA
MEDSEKAGTRCQAGPEPCRPAENPRGAAGGWRPSRVLDGGQGQFHGDVAGQGDPSWSVGLGVTGEAGRRADSSKCAVLCPGLASHTRLHPHAQPQLPLPPARSLHREAVLGGGREPYDHISE